MRERDVMRALNRNKRKLYYALYRGEEPVRDEYGYETGESIPTYGAKTELSANVSAAVGEEVVQAFGSFTNYSRVVCVADNRCPLAEHAIVWFGIAPAAAHNYIVTRKADSKNGVLYALKEVAVKA